MSNVQYISYGQYLSYAVNTQSGEVRMIQNRIDELLEKRHRSFYWLSKETGISHTTLWRLKKGKALGINFDTLEKLCHALECQPGDMLSFTNGKQATKRQRAKPETRK